MDTKTFEDLTPEEYKKQTQLHWGGTPCGSNKKRQVEVDKNYFEDIETERYREHPWILENIKRFDISGKDVVEVGVGMGTDHLNLARQGAQMHAVELTHRHKELTENRLALYDYKTDIRLGDAEKMPFDDNSIDFVYSFGVIHHTPDTEVVISEICRILKPGGRCWITVYHRNSLFFLWSVFLCDWILKFGFLKEKLRNRISRIEYPNDNPNLVIRLYGEKEFSKLFERFSKVESSIDHLVPANISIFGRFFSKKFCEKLARKFGWYVVVEAVK